MFCVLGGHGSAPSGTYSGVPVLAPEKQARAVSRSVVLHCPSSSQSQRQGVVVTKKAERRERERMLFLEPSTIDDIADLIASGQSLSAWCRRKDVRFLAVWDWINADKERLAVYVRGCEAFRARITDKVNTRIEAMLDADPRQAFTKDGKMKKPGAIPDSLIPVLSEISVGGRGGDRVRMVPPDRAVELAGKSVGLFKDRLEVEVTEGLSTRLAAARHRAAGRRSGG